MTHAQCGGVLKRKQKRGIYKCDKCGGIVDVGDPTKRIFHIFDDAVRHTIIPSLNDYDRNRE